MVGSIGYREPTITLTSVEAALESLKYTNKDVTAAHSLYRLTLVEVALADPSAPTSPLMREFALRQVLTDLITKYYRPQVSATVFSERQTHSESEVYANIQRDAQTDNPDYIGWSILYHLYVVTAPSLSQDQYAQHASIVTRTVYRYKKTALKQLTHALIQAEWSVRRQRVRQRLLALVPPSDGIPLVGREAELRQIESALERTPYPCIVIGGPPGCGKSALVCEVARRLIDQERVTFLILLDGPRTLAEIDTQIQEQLRAARLKGSWDELTASYPVLVVLENSQTFGANSLDWDEILSVRLGRTITLVAGQVLLPTQRAGLHFSLSDLGPTAAAELVRALLHASSRDTTSYESYAKTVWQTVGGNPAAIRLIVSMLERGDIAFFEKGVLAHIYDRLDMRFDQDAQCLWDVLTLFPQGIAQEQLQMLGSTEAIGTLLHHGILTSKGRRYTLSHSAHVYRARYEERGGRWIWAKIFEDAESQWGWAAAYLLGHGLESPSTDNASVLLTRYQHEMAVFPHRWRFALQRWASALDMPLMLTYAVCLLKLGEIKDSRRLVQEVIRQAGKCGDFMLQAEALLVRSALRRHQGYYLEALQDLQQVKQMRYLSESLQERLIEEEVHIALDSEDHVRLETLLPRLTGTAPASYVLRLEAAVILGEWDECQRLVDQLQHESPGEEAWVLTILGRRAHDSNAFDQAADYFQAALMQFEQQQDIRSLSRTQLNLASSLLALEQGEAQRQDQRENRREDAKTLLDAAAHSMKVLGDRVGMSAVQANLDYLSRLNRLKPL